MTALERYEKLESTGLWRQEQDAQRRDVVISFGDATLVISDMQGRVLTHWSLPAVRRQNPGERPAVFAPDLEASEAVEIADDLLIDAIEEISAALARARPKPGKLRYWTTAGLVIFALAMAVFWLPGALMRQTLSVVPLPQRTQIGATILGHIQSRTGPICREVDGVDAAALFIKRLLGAEDKTQLVVLPELPQGAVALPGGIIALDGRLLTQTDDPAAVAGYILAAAASRAESDPLETVLRRAGLRTTFQLLTTGALPPEQLDATAQAVVAGAATNPTLPALRSAFETAQVSSGPYQALSLSRNDNATRLEDPPISDQQWPLILTDDTWVSLQNICNS